MAERQACGFGLLQQDSRLDAASAAHAKYLTDLSISQSINWTGHGEDATKPGFTGAGPWDRALAAGFPNNRVAEILNALSTLHATSASDQFAMNEAQGAGSMRSLISTVYHLVGAMTAGRAGGVGSAHASGPFTTPGYSLEVFRFGALIGDPNNNLQKLGTGTIATYPCAAATHASASWAPATESPNPFADVTSTAVFYGTPVYLKVDAPSVLIVTSASIARPDGSLVAARQVTKATDPAGEVGANEFFVVPTAALVVGTTYSVAAAGTVDGVAFTKTFTFTPAP